MNEERLYKLLQKCCEEITQVKASISDLQQQFDSFTQAILRVPNVVGPRRRKREHKDDVLGYVPFDESTTPEVRDKAFALMESYRRAIAPDDCPQLHCVTCHYEVGGRGSDNADVLTTTRRRMCWKKYGLHKMTPAEVLEAIEATKD